MRHHSDKKGTWQERARQRLAGCGSAWKVFLSCDIGQALKTGHGGNTRKGYIGVVLCLTA